MGNIKIKRRPDGRYQTSIIINGKRKYIYARTQKELTEKKSILEEDSQKALFYNDKITLSEWIDIWYKKKKRIVSKSTLTNYKTIIKKHIIPTLGSIKLVDIKRPMIYKLLNSLEGKSDRTLYYVHHLIKTILEQAVIEELIPKNVAINILPTVETKRKKEKISLTKLQVKEFLNVIDDVEIFMFFQLAFATGLRRSELLGLRWSDIDFDNKTLSVNQTVIKDGSTLLMKPTAKTNSSRRTISLDNYTLSNLNKHLLTIKERQSQTVNWKNYNLVFPSIDGNPYYPDTVSKYCKKYAKQIGIDNFTMHGTRHTHATLLLEAGVNFKIIQVRLGHSSFQETMNTYSHVTPILEVGVIENVEDIFL